MIGSYCICMCLLSLSNNNNNNNNNKKSKKDYSHVCCGKKAVMMHPIPAPKKNIDIDGRLPHLKHE